MDLFEIICQLYKGKSRLTPDLPQFAVAAAAWLNYKDDRQKLQVWVLPPGLQKT